jgi:endogenous inhibitor of DNA gyrase (YacG/DUF329 family)
VDVDVRRFRGITFRRYPKAKRASHRRYFSPSAADVAKGVEALHREIWKHYRGPIPAGHHIHHRDGDPLNNSISNLECVTPSQHRIAHRDDHQTPEQRSHLQRVAHLAAAWHRSTAGRRWHAEHAKRVDQKRPREERRCAFCHAPFIARSGGNARFCSRRCIKRAKPEQPRHQKTCPHCRKGFVSVKKRAVFCSRSCANLARWAARRM